MPEDAGASRNYGFCHCVGAPRWSSGPVGIDCKGVQPTRLTVGEIFGPNEPLMKIARLG